MLVLMGGLIIISATLDFQQLEFQNSTAVRQIVVAAEFLFCIAGRVESCLLLYEPPSLPSRVGSAV
jgi:hypothetical protein